MVTISIKKIVVNIIMYIKMGVNLWRKMNFILLENILKTLRAT